MADALKFEIITYVIALYLFIPGQKIRYGFAAKRFVVIARLSVKKLIQFVTECWSVFIIIIF